MPTAALVVHDEPHTRELAVTALRAAFLEVVGFDDPMAALNAIDDDLASGLSHPCNIRIGQTEWDCSGADGESEAAGHESCFSSLAQRMHLTRRASGCSDRS